MSPTRGSLGSASIRGREPSSPNASTNPAASASAVATAGASTPLKPAESPTGPGAALAAPELFRTLAEVKGQAQFLLYLADQIEESLEQLTSEADPCHGAFLCKILSMYSSQLESKHLGLGEKIAETCQEVYVTVREFEPA
jgi:hypothetical protein